MATPTIRRGLARRQRRVVGRPGLEIALASVAALTRRMAPKVVGAAGVEQLAGGTRNSFAPLAGAGDFFSVASRRSARTRPVGADRAGA